MSNSSANSSGIASQTPSVVPHWASWISSWASSRVGEAIASLSSLCLSTARPPRADGDHTPPLCRASETRGPREPSCLHLPPVRLAGSQEGAGGGLGHGRRRAGASACGGIRARRRGSDGVVGLVERHRGGQGRQARPRRRSSTRPRISRARRATRTGCSWWRRRAASSSSSTATSAVAAVPGHHPPRPVELDRAGPAGAGVRRPTTSTAGRFYVAYTIANNDVRIAQYRRSGSNPDVADPASARIVLTVPHRFANHNGGQLAFGPDGDLYFGIGDGGSEGDPMNLGQNTSVLDGKILRISPRANGGYSIPTDNPFVGKLRQATRDLGVRSAQSLAVLVRSPDRRPGDRRRRPGQVRGDRLRCARHRQGRQLRLEHLRGRPRYKPGNAPGAVFPVLVAPHSAGYCAIIGGYVVRDHSLPRCTAATCSATSASRRSTP